MGGGGGGGGRTTCVYIMYIAGRIVAAIHMEFRRTKKESFRLVISILQLDTWEKVEQYIHLKKESLMWHGVVKAVKELVCYYSLCNVNIAIEL